MTVVGSDVVDVCSGTSWWILVYIVVYVTV